MGHGLLEYTGADLPGHRACLTVAWAMDGFKNITARGLGFSSVLLPSAALFGYALLFFGLAMWRFRRVSECWMACTVPPSRACTSFLAADCRGRPY